MPCVVCVSCGCVWIVGDPDGCLLAGWVLFVVQFVGPLFNVQIVSLSVQFVIQFVGLWFNVQIVSLSVQFVIQFMGLWFNVQIVSLFGCVYVVR